MTRDLLYELVHLYNVELAHGQDVDAEQIATERKRALEMIEAETEAA